MDNVTPEEIKLFLSIDRELYAVLVRDLSQNAMESLHVMGLWLWLERRGSFNLVDKISRLPINSIETLFYEAVACLKCLEDPSVGGTTEIPFTRHISEIEEASLHYFRENRLIAFHGVQRLVSKVCTPALSDILETACGGGFQNNPAQNQVVLLPVHGAQGVSADSLLRNIIRRRIRRDPRQGPSRGDLRCDRTMFVTFSKGHLISDIEVWSIIVQIQGHNCIESIYMQDVPPGVQAIYAKVVFTHPSYIESVLAGHKNVKFRVNRKQVWMRKFV